MKDDTRIVEIDGKKYAIERTFDSSPAIYTALALVSPVHIDEFTRPPVQEIGSASAKFIRREWPSPVDSECVVIIARKIKPH